MLTVKHMTKTLEIVYNNTTNYQTLTSYLQNLRVLNREIQYLT